MVTPGRYPTIHPVILSVPEDKKHLVRKEKVIFLSTHAREALKISARKIGVSLTELPKDRDGMPLPVKGIHWSLTHKSNFVGGVAAHGPVGIDLEKFRPCSEALYDKIAGAREWELAGGKSIEMFFRFWTSKESVLKASGDGIKGLSRCRVIRLIDDNHLEIAYPDRKWTVEHLVFNGHIATIVQNDRNVDWSVLGDNPSED